MLGETIKLNGMKQGEKYHYVSFTGKPGEGVVWFDLFQGKKIYKYQGNDGDVSVCHPSSVNTFIRAEFKIEKGINL